MGLGNMMKWTLPPTSAEDDASDLAKTQAVGSQNYRGFPELLAPF